MNIFEIPYIVLNYNRREKYTLWKKKPFDRCIFSQPIRINFIQTKIYLMIDVSSHQKRGKLCKTQSMNTVAFHVEHLQYNYHTYTKPLLRNSSLLNKKWYILSVQVTNSSFDLSLSWVFSFSNTSKMFFFFKLI